MIKRQSNQCMWARRIHPPCSLVGGGARGRGKRPKDKPAPECQHIFGIRAARALLSGPEGSPEQTGLWSGGCEQGRLRARAL